MVAPSGSWCRSGLGAGANNVRRRVNFSRRRGLIGYYVFGDLGAQRRRRRRLVRGDDLLAHGHLDPQISLELPSRAPRRGRHRLMEPDRQRYGRSRPRRSLKPGSRPETAEPLARAVGPPTSRATWSVGARRSPASPAPGIGLHPEPLRAGALRGGAEGGGRHQGGRRRGARGAPRDRPLRPGVDRSRSARACPATSRRRWRSAPSSATTKGEILLVQRADSGVWLYPTGWADIGYSPSEVAVKEVRGGDRHPVRAGAGPRPSSTACGWASPASAMYMVVFHCRAIGGELQRPPARDRRRRLVRRGRPAAGARPASTGGAPRPSPPSAASRWTPTFDPPREPGLARRALRSLSRCLSTVRAARASACTIDDRRPPPSAPTRRRCGRGRRRRTPPGAMPSAAVRAAASGAGSISSP